jgi:hypothetical protein
MQCIEYLYNYTSIGSMPPVRFFTYRCCVSTVLSDVFAHRLGTLNRVELFDPEIVQARSVPESSSASIKTAWQYHATSLVVDLPLQQTIGAHLTVRACANAKTFSSGMHQCMLCIDQSLVCVDQGGATRTARARPPKLDRLTDKQAHHARGGSRMAA